MAQGVAINVYEPGAGPLKGMVKRGHGRVALLHRSWGLGVWIRDKVVSTEAEAKFGTRRVALVKDGGGSLFTTGASDDAWGKAQWKTFLFTGIWERN